MNMSTIHPTQSSADLIEIEERWGAHNYQPLDLVIDARRRCVGLSTWKAAATWTASAPIPR